MPKKPAKSAKTTKSKNYVIAKTEDGTLQITYTIPFTDIKKAQDKVIEDYAPNTQIPGFRKGKAPKQKILESIPRETLIEKSLSSILPNYVAETIKNEKLSLAIYPKFELINSDDGEDWQVRAITCELPKVVLGDYKTHAQGKIREGSLWTPEKGQPEKKKELTHQEREQIAIESILATTKVNIPKLLVDEEVNARLSKLLERIEKLGLTLEQYLDSVGKKVPDLRAEYQKQSEDVLILDLALLEIAEKEGVEVPEEEVDSAIKASDANPEVAKRLGSNDQRRAIKTILTKRKALESIIHL